MTNKWVLRPLVAGVCLFGASRVRAADKITFTENIAPILYQNCVTCHRPGEAAPFSLISFDDVKKRGSLIAAVTQSRYMPPWHAAHGYGEFAGERRLTDAQIASIGAWVKDGMPEGDRSRMPKLPEFTNGWHLGTPDLIVEMPTGYSIPASGPDQFRNFVIPINIPEDKWVRAVEFRPTARNVVHHAIFGYAKGGTMAARDGADGKPGFPGAVPVGLQAAADSGSLGGWATGGTATLLPEGLAMRLPKGSDFVLQIHFHPSGKAETERSVVGFYFADHAPEHNLIDLGLPTLFSFGKTLDIAPGSKDIVVEESMVLPVDVRAYVIAAHAHYLGKEMKATATLPDGSIKPLLWIQDWDFNWQDNYIYKDPFDLPKGTRIDVRIAWDNSADNPRNPRNPPHRVKWGIQSQDEMGGIGLTVTAKSKDDEKVLLDLLANKDRAVGIAGFQNGNLSRMNQTQRTAQAPSVRIAIVDQHGVKQSTIGEPGLFGQPAFSPDGSSVAAILTDQETGVGHIWIYDATGKGSVLTKGDDSNVTPVWSPDGKSIAWARSGAEAYQIFRQSADGSGEPELLYQHDTGGTLFVTDWSNDMLCFWATDTNFLYIIPLKGNRKAIKMYSGRGGRLSPDGKYLSYSHNGAGIWTTYVRPIDLINPDTKEVRLYANTAQGGGVWRADGKALLFPSMQGLGVSGLWQVAIETFPELRASEPELVWRPTGIQGPAQLSSFASADFQKFVTLVPIK